MPRDWASYTSLAAEFHQRNARAWGNDRAGKDLAAQIDPDFTLGRSRATGLAGWSLGYDRMHVLLDTVDAAPNSATNVFAEERAHRQRFPRSRAAWSLQGSVTGPGWSTPTI